MTVQLSVAVRNARIAAIESTAGTSPLFRIYTGTVPADCATAASGTKLIEATLPSDWMGNPSSGSASKSGTWSVAAVATGTGGYYRIYDSTGTTCHEQGTVTATGGGGDLTLDNTSINNGQTVTIATYTTTDGNA